MPFTRWSAWLLLALVCGCGGTVAATHVRPGEAAVDPKDAAQGARGVVTEIYGDLRRGDVGGVQSLIAPDAFAVGPGAADVFSTREDAVVALGAVMRSGDRHKVASHALKVAGAPGGHSAWVSDALEVDGVSLALTAVLVESDGLWNVVAVHVGRTLSDAQLDEKAGKRAPLPGGVAKGAAAALTLYRAGVAAPEKFVAQLAAEPEVLVLGVGAHEVTRGVKPVKKLWKKRLAAAPKLSLDGEPRAALTPDGSLAWIFANVDVAVGSGAKEPYRSLVLYEKLGTSWQLVAMHDSVAFGK